MGLFLLDKIFRGRVFKIMQVFVLLFNVGTDNEGIHTIQTGDRNKVLMFESEDDAVRYALLLEAQDFETPSIIEIDSQEIMGFCESANYEWELVAEGMLAIPPQRNLPETSWNPHQPTTENQLDEAGISSEELERFRRQLEGLL